MELTGKKTELTGKKTELTGKKTELGIVSYCFCLCIFYIKTRKNKLKTGWPVDNSKNVQQQEHTRANTEQEGVRYRSQLF